MTDTQKIRQLERQLADCDDVSEPDVTKKIDILNDLAWALSDTDLKRAQALSETACALATAANDDQSPYQAGLAYSLRTQGYLNLRLGDYPLGLSQLFKAQEIFESLQLDEGLTDVFDNIAGIYFQIGNFPEALIYMYKQLEAAQRLGDKRLVANAYNNLANIYFETGDYDRAVETLQENLQLAVETDYKRIECLSYLNLTETYLLAGDYEPALENARRGLQVSQTAGFELFEVYAFDLIGKSYLKLGEAGQAINYLEQALALSRKVESKVTESLILLNMGQAYRDLQQFDVALHYGRQGITTAQTIDAKGELFKGHLLLSEIYEQQGDFAQALHHFKQYQTFKELVLGEKANQRLKVLQVAHDTETARREAEIHKLHNVELKQEIAERQRREERLWLLESVVKHATDGVLVTEAAPLGPPGPRIVYVNQALIKMTGYAKEELVGQNPRLLQGPKTDRLALDQMREALAHNRPVAVELINYTKTGRELWIELSISPVADETGQTTHFVAVQREVTDRKRIEAALESSQERYHLATQAAGVGVWDWNLQTGDFYLDPIIKAILGYSDDEIPNDLDVWADYIHPDDRQGVMEAAQAHIDGWTPDYTYEHRMLHKDGSIRWVFVHGKVIKDEQGQAIRMAGTDTDITARKEAEQKLKRQIHYAEALALCSRTLLMANRDETENRQLLREALKHLIEPAQASKVFLYENFDDPELGFCSRFILDACAPGIPPALDDPNSAVIPWSIAPDENRRRLEAGEPVGGPVKELFASTPPFRDYLLNKVHVLSVQFFPIHFGECWWGYVGFDDRVNEREWDKEEIVLLGTAAEMLSNTLQRWQVEDNLRTINDRLEQQVKVRTADLSDTIALLQQEINEREQAQAETQRLLATLEQSISARTQELSTFFDLTVLAGRAANLADVFQQAIPRILEVTRSRVICIHLFDDDRTGLYLAAQQNLPGRDRTRLQIVELPPDFQRWLQQLNDPLVTTTLSTMNILPPAFRLTGFQTYLGAQISIGHRIEGLLSCFRFTERGFALDEISLVVALAEQMGMVLETHRLRRTAEEVAVLEERQRLARELHDSVTQSIYSLTLFARSGREAVEDGDMTRLSASLIEIEESALHILQEMRLLLYELRAPLLEREGLVQAIDSRLNLVERRAGLQVNYEVALAQRKLPKTIELELYRLAIEALNNIIKHADARTVTVGLRATNGRVHLEINDDGRGFDPRQQSSGFGLAGMQERVDRLGGALEIASTPGHGAKISIEVDVADD